MVQQRRDQAWSRLSQGMGKPGQVERRLGAHPRGQAGAARRRALADAGQDLRQPRPAADRRLLRAVRLRLPARSEEHTSELQSLMRISYAVFFLKNKKVKNT